MAEHLIDKVETDTTQRIVRAIEQPEQEVHPFKCYTWQVGGEGNKLKNVVIYGENLQGATSLQIGRAVIALQSSKDGRTAVGNYPEEAVEGDVMRISVGGITVDLEEPFSLGKPDELPSVGNCRFVIERIKTPVWMDSDDEEIQVLRFECDVEEMVFGNAPITVFIGDVAIPNNRLTEEKTSISGYVYDFRELKENVPVTIDFGQGLRSMSTSFYTTLPDIN